MEDSVSLSDDDSGEWSRERLRFLKESIKSFSPSQRSKVKESRILMLGPVGAGKSSFYNTISTIFSGHITIHAPSGCSEKSVTTKYRMYRILCPDSSKPMKFRLCDTRGLEENQGIDSEDVKNILQGHVADHHQFKDSQLKVYTRWFWKIFNVVVYILWWIGYLLKLIQTRPIFLKESDMVDRIHCVCMIIDGSTASVLPEAMLAKIKSIQSVVRDAGVPFMIIMTKIDKLCQDVDTDTSSVFRSKAIQDQVNAVAQIFGVPRNHVLLVKNYEKEYTPKLSISILALTALRNLLGATADYINASLLD